MPCASTGRGGPMAHALIEYVALHKGSVTLRRADGQWRFFHRISVASMARLLAITKHPLWFRYPEEL